MSRGKRTHFLADLLKPPRFLNRIFLYLDLALSSQFGHTFLPITQKGKRRSHALRFSSKGFLAFRTRHLNSAFSFWHAKALAALLACIDAVSLMVSLPFFRPRNQGSKWLGYARSSADKRTVFLVPISHFTRKNAKIRIRDGNKCRNRADLTHKRIGNKDTNQHECKGDPQRKTRKIIRAIAPDHKALKALCELLKHTTF